MFSSDSRSLLRFLQRGAEGDGAGGFQIVEGNHVGALGHIDALHGALAIGRLFQVLHAPAPQIALGHVGDTAEIQVVLRRDEAQVRQRVLYLASGEERHVGVHGVGDLLADEGFLHGPRGVMGLVEHRDVAVGPWTQLLTFVLVIIAVIDLAVRARK